MTSHAAAKLHGPLAGGKKPSKPPSSSAARIWRARSARKFAMISPSPSCGAREVPDHRIGSNELVADIPRLWLLAAMQAAALAAARPAFAPRPPRRRPVPCAPSAGRGPWPSSGRRRSRSARPRGRRAMPSKRGRSSPAAERGGTSRPSRKAWMRHGHAGARSRSGQGRRCDPDARARRPARLGPSGGSGRRSPAASR